MLATSICVLFLANAASAAELKFNMSYIYFGKSSLYKSYVDKTQNSLNEISPNYFSLSIDGSLRETTAVSKVFVDEMHKEGILVVPYLTNDWSRRAGINALNDREALSSQLADAVNKYNLDGINIDLENLTRNERAAYVDFARLLREKLPADKKVTVAVAANPYGAATGWQGSYDYAGLAENCDYLIIMAYDEHYEYGPAGPVSSISFIEKSVEYALSTVPKEKIVLGLPFYGRIWSDTGEYPNGYGVSNKNIEKLVADYNGTISFDESSKSAFATFKIGPTDTKPVIGGQVLSEDTYTIWFDNEESIKAKLKLVDKYGIKGTGSWSLGQESTDTWNYYKLWLNGCTFNDIQDSWAKDDILNAYVKNLVVGKTPDTFAPEESLTRAEAATILVRKLGLTPQIDLSNGFDDCKGNWAEAYIDTARRYHIISGLGDNLFAPDAPVTRQEMAVMLNNILRYGSGGIREVFSDVSYERNNWSYDSIYALSENGIIKGYPDGSFKPENNLTRAEMTALIVKTSLT